MSVAGKTVASKFFSGRDGQSRSDAPAHYLGACCDGAGFRFQTPNAMSECECQLLSLSFVPCDLLTIAVGGPEVRLQAHKETSETPAGRLR